MNRDFRDIIVELLSAEVRFLVVGAYAVGAHGIPRATVDLDLWIEGTPANAERVLEALQAFGAPIEALGIGAADLVRPGTFVQFGVPPYRIDFMNEIDGVRFAEAWEGRVYATFQGIETPFIGRPDLIANKRVSGRPKDLDDLEQLAFQEKGQGPR